MFGGRGEGGGGRVVLLLCREEHVSADDGDDVDVDAVEVHRFVSQEVAQGLPGGHAELVELCRLCRVLV